MILLTSGCASHRRGGPPRDPHPGAFWHDCKEDLDAPRDGWQHFTCTDMHGNGWTVRIKPDGSVDARRATK